MTEKKTLHYSEGKPGVDQIPPDFLLQLGMVYTYGAGKYARDNWKLGTEWSQFYGSALRHLLSWWSGEDYDRESHLHHLAHAAWNLATLYYYQTHSLGTDNREKGALPEC